MAIINETEIRKAIQQFHPGGDLFEVRVITPTSKKQYSGFFKDVEILLEELKRVPLRNSNIYFTLNQIDDVLYNRMQRDCFVSGGNGTKDDDIDGFKWFFIDLDPKRKAGISSTEEELQKAYKLAGKITAFLKSYGFEDPVKAMSGNGAHILYRINLKRTEENKELLRKCLLALSMMFDTEDVEVDTGNFNPSRVCKLYGTLAQKGASTKERPHRMSRIFGAVKECKFTDKAYIEKLAAILPVEEKPATYNNYKPNDFDIEEWMNKYGIHYTPKQWKDGTKYILDECPFDANHKAPDSMITKMANGALGFKCFHNHCANYTWRDVRLKFDPQAYEYNDNDKRIEEGFLRHNRDKAKAETVPAYQQDDSLPIFQTAEMILGRVVPEPEYISTGINKIDKAICGLEKGKVSLISGLRASGKSTLLSELMLNAIEKGHVVVAYSGELTDVSFMNWMYLQAAGKAHTTKSATYEDGRYVEAPIKEQIAQWMGTKLWLYNNVKSNKPSYLLKNIREKCIEAKSDMVVIDNLMAVDVQELNRTNEYDAQTRFMWELKKIAQDCNVHILLVAHPRKSIGFLRLEDVSGSNNIVNIIDNAFIVHRNNADFKEKAKTILKSVGDAWMIDDGSKVTNVVEIAKDREHGTCDLFVDLYYEPESKRLKNYLAETISYSWEKDNDGFLAAEQMEIPFEEEEHKNE